MEELRKCTLCPDFLLANEIEFVLDEKPYCKSCVDGDKELSEKSHHATRILITGALYGLSMEQQKDLHKQLQNLFPNFDRLYGDLMYHETCVEVVDNESKEILHTIPRP
tara:strand:- start:151 stop:477 length:327 start_codon:yes stop_codon:yes gene_type:complete